MSTAEYQREWRARRGARTGRPGPPVVHECGTPAAYTRHKRRGEDVDEACRTAWNTYQRERRAARQAEAAAREAEAARKGKRRRKARTS